MVLPNGTLVTDVRQSQGVGIANAGSAVGLETGSDDNFDDGSGTTKLFSGTTTGQLMKLPAWLYPVVIGRTTCSVRFDNDGGPWRETGVTSVSRRSQSAALLRSTWRMPSGPRGCRWS